MGATNRALTFPQSQNEVLPHEAGRVKQLGGALFDIRCSAIAKELMTVRE
jgi:hypothetical protein